MTASTADVLPIGPDASASGSRVAPSPSLRTSRLNLMRGGYLLMAVGLALTKWPLLGRAASLPAFEGVVVALLTAMSLLALLGLRYPVRMMPLLIFESLWKVIWLAVVGIPYLAAHGTNAELDRILVNVSMVVVIIAVTPWDHVWKRYVMAPGDAWR
jgi:hypothetical protein